MANDITATLQASIKTIVTSLKSMKNEVSDLEKQYFDSGASTLVDGLASNSTAATVTSKLNKGEYVNGITLCQALINFFGNAAVTQSDYLSMAHNLVNGSDAAGTALSNDVEDIGNRLKSLGQDAIQNFKLCKDALLVYSSNEISDIVAVLDAHRVIFGADMTQSELSAGITLIEQFKKMLNNEVVTTGDYASTVVKWERL